MSKVLIQTKDSFQGQKIRQILEDMYIKGVVSFGRKSTFNGMLHEKPQLFIYDTSIVTHLTFEYIDEIYQRGFDKPTLILVDKASPQLKDFDKYKRVHVLEKQLMSKMLSSLCVRLIENPDLETQAFRRYSTFQPMRIESLLDGAHLDSFMTNLSLGGACCVFEDDSNINLGDLVRLKVSLNELDRQHNMHAKVVWKKRDDETGQTGIGLKFISEHDMYNQLLDHI